MSAEGRVWFVTLSPGTDGGTADAVLAGDDLTVSVDLRVHRDGWASALDRPSLADALTADARASLRLVPGGTIVLYPRPEVINGRAGQDPTPWDGSRDDDRTLDGGQDRAEAIIAAVHDAEGRALRLYLAQGDVNQAHRAQLQLELLAAELEHRVEARTAELAAANRQLAAANRELDTFNHTLAHDLRRHLRTVSSFAALLATDYGTLLDDEARRLIQRIESGCDRIDDVLTALNDLLRAEHAAPAPIDVDVSALARDVVATLRASAPDRVVAVEIESGMRVQADPALFRVALENLIENAWKYTALQPVGHIDVGRGPGDAHTLVVRDNGVGFDSHDATRLFIPFTRLDNAQRFPGTGLGLATVRRIAERLGGSTWCEPRPEGGAVFYFRLPESSAAVGEGSA
mgnify:CR=1 FL=1